MTRVGGVVPPNVAVACVGERSETVAPVPSSKR